MTVLALTTSTPRASVAVLENDRVLAECSYEDPRGHAERLFTLIDDALAAAGRFRSDLHLIACDIGPGSFTGVRIAVASAKGIALALDVPLAGVVSLEAMAAHARASCPPHALVAAAVDAKKGELYLAVYDGSSELLSPVHLPAEEASSRVAAVVAGRPFVSVADTPAFAAFAPDASVALVAPPDAAWIGRLALALGIRPSPLPDVDSTVADLVPLYVRAPDAVPTFSGPAAALAMLPPR